MRNFNLILLILSSFYFQSSAQLIISGVYDGPLSGGTPKGVELHAKEDISDLSIYGIGSANNGGGSDGEEFSLPSQSLAAGEKFYISSESSQFTAWFGFAPDATSGAMSINGDDAIELFKNGSVTDVFGDINVDGTGQSWEYLDGWAYRTNSLSPDGSFDLADWMFSGPNALDGESSNATATSPFPVGTLPVDLVSFEAKRAGQVVLLSWVTSTEINNDRFEIERSLDGKSFDQIGSVDGHGNSAKQIEYKFEDSRPAAGVSYYRLKQVDLDGQYEYSAIVAATYRSSKITIAPTKTHDIFTVQVTAQSSSSIAVYNSAGQVLLIFDNVEGEQLVDMSAFASGTYFVSVVSNGTVQTEKILKL